MKDQLIKLLSSTGLSVEELDKLIEVPKNPEMGDYAFPCFILASKLKKSPVQIASEISSKINSKDFEKIQAVGPYVNFFVNIKDLTNTILKKILKEKEKYGQTKNGKGKTIVIDMSSPNIAKPFGIGHLRSTIIGNSISNIYKSQGYKVVKINYLGDWGTQFGKLIVGYKRWGNASKLKQDPISHLLELYVKVNQDESLEPEAREWFKKLEDGDKEAIKLWNQFSSLSLKEFEKIYSLLNVNFDVMSGESHYNNKMDSTIKELEKKGLLEESEGAWIVNLEKYGLPPCLIKKSDGATLYATRDLTAAIDRYNKYKFSKALYEVGAEQKLHFKQVFTVLKLMGYKWADECIHIDHGLYLDKDGKKFSTRKGKTIFMSDVLNETIELAKKEVSKRERLTKKELETRAKSIATSAIIYGDLKNYRASDIIFDIERFLSFEGDTGPYLLYTYARAKSILKKAKYIAAQYKLDNITQQERNLVSALGKFEEIIAHASRNNTPNVIANYSFEISKLFNEFYHSNQVIGTEEEKFRLTLVYCFSQVLKNSLDLLGIKALEKM